jgi:ankyrin repeat protein
MVSLGCVEDATHGSCEAQSRRQIDQDFLGGEDSLEKRPGCHEATARSGFVKTFVKSLLRGDTVSSDEERALIVRDLLHSGAPISVIDQFNQTPFHYATICGLMPVLVALLEMGSSIAFLEDINGNTPLHLACHMGQLSVVDLLLGIGANSHKKNRDMQDAYMVAKCAGKIAIMKRIRDHEVHGVHNRTTSGSDEIMMSRDFASRGRSPLTYLGSI